MINEVFSRNKSAQSIDNPCCAGTQPGQYTQATLLIGIISSLAIISRLVVEFDSGRMEVQRLARMDEVLVRGSEHIAVWRDRLHGIF